MWFPEATWILTDNLLLLPMRWVIIDVAQQAGAQIIPMALDYDREKKICRVCFGKKLDAEIFADKQRGINTLRDAMATLRWEFISRKSANRRNIDIKKEKSSLFEVVYDYPPLEWEYEKSCIYWREGVVDTVEVFSHLKAIRPTMQKAFLFNKRLKG